MRTVKHIDAPQEFIHAVQIAMIADVKEDEVYEAQKDVQIDDSQLYQSFNFDEY